MKSSLQKIFFAAAFFLVIASVSCRHKFYTASNFDELTRNHRKVAILPAEMIFTGVKPTNMSISDIKKMEEIESTLFQQYLHNSILKYSNASRHKTDIAFQETKNTLQLLEKNNISIRESWTMNTDELIRILGVDAVVRMKIQKERYMSDLASLGITIGQTVLNQIGRPGSVLTGTHNRTSTIYSSCSLISDDVVLWNDAYERSSDYYTPGRKVVTDITDKFGKNFPYKKKKRN
ncbi:MAG: hypothetical protein ABIN48_03350 [Ginsengibacter sp.]